MFDVGLWLYILIYLVEYVKKFRRKLSQVAVNLLRFPMKISMSICLHILSKPCTNGEELFLLVKGFE